MNPHNSTLARLEESKSLNKEITNRDTYGDLLKKKSSKNIRISFQNINGFMPKDKEDKKELIRDYINDYKIDVCMML